MSSKRGCCVILHSLVNANPVERLILLCKRSIKEDVGAGKWCFPCGTVDCEESPKCAAERELSEETGFIECNLHKIAEYEYKGWVDTVFVTYADYNLSLPNVGISDEVDEYVFASIEAIEMLIKNDKLFEYSVKSFEYYKQYAVNGG